MTLLRREGWMIGLVVGLMALALGCGDDTEPPPGPCDDRGVVSVDAMAAPPGVRRGEAYRWLGRRWQSPLGLTFVTYGLAVDGLPVVGRHQVEIYDRRGQLVHRAGSGDAVLAALRAKEGSSGPWLAHPLTALAERSRQRRRRPDPLAHRGERAVWYVGDGALVPAVASERLDLRDDEPLGELSIRDAVTGAVLAQRRTIYDLIDPAYRVYAHEDGRPLYSPLGDTLPHPTGAPDGQVPPFVAQRSVRQRGAAAALADPWVPVDGTQTQGNNVVAFFNSLRDGRGRMADFVDARGEAFTPEYGPGPELAGGDFLVQARAGAFEVPYDPTRSSSEYFQAVGVGEPIRALDDDDVATRAKIVQAFYGANWLHDFFYAAGFDERAGNAQLSNLGRGGEECDPLLVHAGFFTTFTFPSPEGQSPVLSMGLNFRSATRRDAAMDFSILGHEWGHYLIGRMVGGTADEDAMGNLQGRSLHEGIADFVGVLINLDPGDDLRGAFAVGTYSNLDYIESRPTLPPAEAPADAAYYGIRRFPYSLDLAKNPLTFRNLATAPGLPFYNWKGRGPQLAEVHTAGEIFSQGLFQCFGNLVAAHPDLPFEQLRGLMAQYLVAGLAAFPDHPSMLDARNAVLAVVRLASPMVDYPACRAGFATRGMGADALGPDREFGAGEPSPAYDPEDVEESFLDQDAAVRVRSTAVSAPVDGAAKLVVELRNTGLIELTEPTVEITPAAPSAVTFPQSARLLLEPLAAEADVLGEINVVLEICQLPPHPTQLGRRLFAYDVAASSPAEAVERRVSAAASIAEPAGGCPGALARSGR